MNRQDAYANGLKFYNSSKACSRGHMSDRYVSTGNCIECQRQYGAKYSQSKKYDVKKFGTKNILRQLNMTIVTYRVDVEDKEALDAYAAALNMQRDVLRSAELAASVTKPTLG